MTLVGVMTAISISSLLLAITIPVMGGVYAAYKAGVTPWEFFSEFASLKTWGEAFFAVGLGAITGKLVLKIAAKIGAKLFSIIGALFSVWSLIQSLKLTQVMASGEISRGDIAHFLAFTTAVILLSTIIGKAFSKKPITRDSVPKESGIYQFKGQSGNIYVGQSKDLFRRIGEHLRSDKLSPKNLKTLKWKTKPGAGKLDLDIAEQKLIDSFGGIRNLENKINVIGKSR